MNSKRKILFMAVVILQAAVLLSMIVKQEILLRTGTKVLLRCVPVDPRSLFSGDYVRLNYEISEIRSFNNEILQKKIDTFSENDTIYIALAKVEGSKFHSIAGFSKNPDELKKNFDVILKGTVDDKYSRLQIRYGLETYFVPQKEGKKIETEMADVSAEVSIAADGRSALSKLFIAGKEVKFY